MLVKRLLQNKSRLNEKSHRCFMEQRNEDIYGYILFVCSTIAFLLLLRLWKKGNTPEKR